MTIDRDWYAANEKVITEGCCRACGSTTRIERAHVTERANDLKPPLGWHDSVVGRWVRGTKTRRVKVHPDRVIPLCMPCHRRDHAKLLDLLPLLSVAEQLQAVADCDGIELARRRLAPSAYSTATKVG